MRPIPEVLPKPIRKKSESPIDIEKVKRNILAVPFPIEKDFLFSAFSVPAAGRLYFCPRFPLIRLVTSVYIRRDIFFHFVSPVIIRVLFNQKISMITPKVNLMS